MLQSKWIRRALVVPILAATSLLTAGRDAAAQVAWDSPLLLPPMTRAGWGVYLTDPAGGEEIGVMAGWRSGGLLGFRVGIAEGRDDGIDVFGGVDMSGPLFGASDDFPLDVGWVAGIGAGGGDNLLLSFPLGITMGRELVSEEMRFLPYVSPRIVLDAWFGDDRPDDDLDLGFALDLGADVAFSPRWAIRFGGTVGDRDAIAIGARFHP